VRSQLVVDAISAQSLPATVRVEVDKLFLDYKELPEDPAMSLRASCWSSGTIDGRTRKRSQHLLATAAVSASGSNV
jgi:hypothetical protein